MASVIITLRWIARVLSAGLIALFCVFLIGEGFPPLYPVSRVTLQFFLLLLCLVGLLIAFRAEALGGMLAFAGSLGFYLVDIFATHRHRLPGGWVLPLLLITPMLYLLTAWRTRAAH